MSLSTRQQRRIRRTREGARRLREVESERSVLGPVYARHQGYWRDLSVEIGGTIVSAVLIFSFGRILGYIERPSGRSEILHLLGLFAVVFIVVFAFVRLRRVRADHPGASSARLITLYLRAVEPHWSVPMLVVGVALSLGYF